jgi:phosphohistidine phosphatase
VKKLLLIRHGKSSWKDRDLSDLQRPLKKRGKRNAGEMAIRLQKQAVVPDHVFCSPANRAADTLRIMSKTTGLGVHNSQVSSDLYVFDAEDLLSWLRNLDDNFEIVAVVGHNPALTDLVNDLASQHIDNVPTCGIVLLDLAVGRWSEVATGCGRLVYFDYPKKAEAEASGSEN